MLSRTKDALAVLRRISGASRTSMMPRKIWFPIILIALLGAARSYYSSRTGFLLPDEAFYVLGTEGKHLGRPVFLGLLEGYFLVTGSTDIFAILTRGPFFGVLWSIGAIIVLYRISLRVAGVRDNAAYCAVAFAVTPIFLLLAPTFLTEPPSLFFALVGTWLLLQYLNSRRYGTLLLSALSFSLCAMIREPYLVLLVGDTLVLFILSALGRISHRSWASFAAAASVTIAIVNPLRSVGTDVYAVGSLVIYGLSGPMHPFGFSLFLSAAENFFASVLLGWSPVVAVMVAAAYLMFSLEAFRTRNVEKAVLVINATLVLGALAYVAILLSRPLGHIYMSFVMRLSHIALPSLVVLPWFFSRSGRKGTLASAAAFLLYLLVFGGALLSQAQSGLSLNPIERFDPSYVAPHYRLYNLLKDKTESILIFAEPTLRASLFLEHQRNIVIKGIMNETEFAQEIRSQSWDKVLLYGELYPDHFAVLHEHAPFYEKLVRNETLYPVNEIWSDKESYLLQVMLKGTGGSGQGPDSHQPLLSSSSKSFAKRLHPSKQFGFLAQALLRPAVLFEGARLTAQCS